MKLSPCPPGNLPCDRPMPVQTGHTADSQTEQYLVPWVGEQGNLAHAEALQCIVTAAVLYLRAGMVNDRATLLMHGQWKIRCGARQRDQVHVHITFDTHRNALHSIMQRLSQIGFASWDMHHAQDHAWAITLIWTENPPGLGTRSHSAAQQMQCTSQWLRSALHSNRQPAAGGQLSYMTQWLMLSHGHAQLCWSRVLMIRCIWPLYEPVDKLCGKSGDSEADFVNESLCKKTDPNRDSLSVAKCSQDLVSDVTSQH